MDHQSWHQQLFLSCFFLAKTCEGAFQPLALQSVLQPVDSSPELSGEGEQRACGRVKRVPVL